MNVVTRIAPSPTGEMHIGTVRTALFNYLFAKHHGGTYLVRIEDTDKERNKPGWIDAIWRDFDWCGLIPDKRFIQSEHLPRHRELLQQLIERGGAYVSKEPAKDDPSRTVEVVRLRNPGKEITFNDLIRGDITFDTTELGDFVIARAIDDPLYHFAVVVDDHDAGVSHVLRAEEHLSNTPRQILIQEALGFERPAYGHFPLILAPDRSKLSKRKHSASVENYRAEGYLPEALINYLALLGWNPGGEQELFSIDELIGNFAIEHVHKAGAVFDPEKLKWFNREYLLKMNEGDFASTVLERLRAALEQRAVQWDEGTAQKLAPLIRERISVWKDIDKLAGEGEFDYFFADPRLDTAKIPQRGTSATDAASHLESVAAILHELPDADFSTPEKIKAALWPYAEEKGRGAVLWPLRYALSGREKSPDPFMIASILGKETALRRIRTAITSLSL